MNTLSNCLVAQSGGPTSVINASLAGVIAASIDSEKIDKIYGSKNGIQGVLKNTLIELNSTFENKSNIDLLKTSPAMYLGSCRYKLPGDINSAEYKAIFDSFKELNIGYFFYIGGNDSMDTVAKLKMYAQANGCSDIKIMGIPKTIDNDLFGTDHTPGFGSAAKFVATTMLEITHDTYIYDLQSVTIVEIMGRNAGWLTAASALARTDYSVAPDLIYLPEKPFSTGCFVNDIRNLLKKKKNIIVAVSEGIKDAEGNYISATNAIADQFGHAQLSGTGKALEHLVKNTIGCKVRSIELNVLQRSAAHIASLTDINEAFLVGHKAVEFAIKGLSGEMVVITRTSNSPYTIEISSLPIEKIANMEKNIPLEWINEEGNDVTATLVDYMKPLIIGEPELQYSNGLPKYMEIIL